MGGTDRVSDQRDLENPELDCVISVVYYFKWLPLRLWRPRHACTPSVPLVLMCCPAGVVGEGNIRTGFCLFCPSAVPDIPE